MSFSGEIKEELMHVSSSARHCQIAELAALLQLCGFFDTDENGSCRGIFIQTENKSVAKRISHLSYRLFQCRMEVAVRRSRVPGSSVYLLKLREREMLEKVLKALKLEKEPDNALLVKNSCCKRAFLRGVYLAVGSMSDPNKSYHLELVLSSQEQANRLIRMMNDFELDAKMVRRKRYYVVYLKEGENISDFLNIIEAHKALLAFESTRVLKDMRNRVNRRVNCDSANIKKTVSAATRQVKSIQRIEETIGLESLPEHLRQMAQVRLENPEVSLEELGKLLDPAVGKSGVNHRLRKLCEIADEL